ncbi:MAG TPA: efflux RND transporter periplasmic adaptor subunit, partial [Pseudomonadales bacterium]|nr:efflux RND transporter periplasmic adaptor subunit [Pseudomonadales bacterium]
DTVWRFDASRGRISRVSVHTGIRNWNFTEIVDGLQVGDRIVVSLDQEKLEDGLLVTAVND